MMTPAQEGAYIRLLCYDWANEGIPDSAEHCSALARLPDLDAVRVVMACFKQHRTKDGFLTNDRLEFEREKQLRWRQKSAEGGKKSAEKRWGTTDKKPNKGGKEMVTTKPQPKGNTISSSSSSSSNKEKYKKEMFQIGGWLKRRPTTNWSQKEISKLKEIVPLHSEDIALMERYYLSDCPYLRKDVYTLLNNWNGELDRARDYLDRQKPSSTQEEGNHGF
jgi:hypothetical protein